MNNFEELTEEEQNEVILNISSKLDKQEIWYWEGLVHKLREYEQFVDSDMEIKKGLIDRINRQQARIDKAIEYLGINEEILETCGIYDVNGIEIYKILQGSDKE